MRIGYDVGLLTGVGRRDSKCVETETKGTKGTKGATGATRATAREGEKNTYGQRLRVHAVLNHGDADGEGAAVEVAVLVMLWSAVSQTKLLHSLGCIGF